MSKFKRFAKGLSAVTLGVGIGYAIDNSFYYSSVTRSFRTFWVIGSVALDYKLNFRPEKIDDIENLHSRTAHKIYNLCRKNGGLYIKFGQQMYVIHFSIILSFIFIYSATVPVLPVAYVKLFRKLYDDAPSHSYEVFLLLLPLS
jgi:aarF domain-containing kinase